MHKPGFLRRGNHRTRDDGRKEEHGGEVRQYLEQTKQAGDTVSVIELWPSAELRPGQKTRPEGQHGNQPDYEQPPGLGSLSLSCQHALGTSAGVPEKQSSPGADKIKAPKTLFVLLCLFSGQLPVSFFASDICGMIDAQKPDIPRTADHMMEVCSDERKQPGQRCPF